MLVWRRQVLYVDRCPVNCDCGYPTADELRFNEPIDWKQNLNGTKVEPYKHVLIASETPIDQLPAKAELVPGSLVHELDRFKRTKLSPTHPVLFLAVDIPGLKHPEVAIFPDGIKVEINQLDDVLSFYDQFLIPPNHEPAPVHNPFAKDTTKGKPSTTGRTPIAVPQIPPKPVLFITSPFTRPTVVICGHAARDQRCGVMGPLLKQVFTDELQKRQLDVDVGLISHIGGHAYAGNVIWLPLAPHQPPVWYGRVFPELVPGIIEQTIIGGKIIKELYRGIIPETKA